MKSFTSFSRKFSLALFLLAAAPSTAAGAKAGSTPSRRLQDAQKLGEAILAEQKAAETKAQMEKEDVFSPSTLEQIHVITRHGSRSMLSKDADSLAEKGGASLTPLGQQQLYDMGEWLKKTYGNYLGGDGDSLMHYNPALHRLESTNLERTLSSANSLALGLFPSEFRSTGMHLDNPDVTEDLYKSHLEQPPAIPVYTGGKDQNDVTLRAYRNCPTFTDRLQKLYASSKWKDLEKSHSGLLKKLGKMFPDEAVGGKIPLENLWNVYDPMVVAKTECESRGDDYEYQSCSAFVTDEYLATEKLDLSEIYKIQVLFEEAEFLKYGQGIDSEGTVTAGNLLGSNLLWKILNRSKGDGDFFLYSAHTATLIGFLSTLQASEDFYKATEGDDSIAYGSALIVEIHKSSEKGNYFFVLKYKAPHIENAIHVVLKESETGIKCGQDKDEESVNIPKLSWCTLDEVIVWASENTLTSEEAWCDACNNKLADVCLTGLGSWDKFGSSTTTTINTISSDDDDTGISRSSNTNTDNTPAFQSEHEQIDAWLLSEEYMGFDTSNTTMICLLFFGGFLAGVLLMGLVWFATCCCNKTKSDAKTVDESPDYPAIGVVDNEEPDESNAESDDIPVEPLDDKEIC